LNSLDRRDLGLDELEAIRLADMLGILQAEAADMMNISQPTFNRILASARRKTAESVVGGFAIRIESPERSDSVVVARGVATSGGACGRNRRRNGR
jgi:predicted DNA-binding protein (UPF0251 family)